MSVRPMTPGRVRAWRRVGGACVLAVFFVAAGVTTLAHDVLYPGTVLEVQPDKLHVKTVDPDSKQEVRLWFTVTADTKVKRGDAPTTYAAAAIVKDERIVVVVNHDAETKGVATELRLAAR